MAGWGIESVEGERLAMTRQKFRTLNGEGCGTRLRALDLFRGKFFVYPRCLRVGSGYCSTGNGRQIVRVKPATVHLSLAETWRIYVIFRQPLNYKPAT